MHDLNSYEITFTETIGSQRGPHYIKVKEIAQNSTGTFYACCYIDDGVFCMRTFGRKSRTNEEIGQDEVRFNKIFGLDNFTMPNEEFDDPFINCCFISDIEIFVNFFYNFKQTHYHFIWNLKSKTYDKLVIKNMECNPTNFPQKCFYSEEA
jgi:hypothetical protein